MEDKIEAKGGSTAESDAAANESNKEEQDGNASNGAGVEQQSVERVRGGGKVAGERARNSRRPEPYSNSGGKSEVDRSRRVYVGNLAWEVSWQDLKDHMKTTGHEVVRANVMMSPDGRSKGCGIVEFATAEGAQEAVKSLNDTELSGRQIFVREDREDRSGGGYSSQKMGGGGGSAHRFSSGEQAQSHRVYVGNLSWDVAWQDLKDHMRQAGEVNHAEVICESNGRSKGCGIVEFASAEEAEKAISTLTDTELKGRMIFVREDRETSSGSSGGFHGQRSNNCSVYVRNLSFETSWQDLKDHMRKAGNVDQATLLTDAQGNSTGSAVVVYQRPQDAVRAIRELQNSELGGRNLSLREDRNQSGGGRGRGGHGGRGRYGGSRGDRSHGSSSEQGSQLFVGNLSFDTTWKELKDHFRQCGDVERAEVALNPEGRSKGYGTVQFYKQSDAENAIRRLNGVDLMGRTLEVRVSTKKSR